MFLLLCFLFGRSDPFMTYRCPGEEKCARLTVRGRTGREGFSCPFNGRELNKACVVLLIKQNHNSPISSRCIHSPAWLSLTLLFSFTLSPCSLTLGANSCSLINYWCSKAVVGLAGSGFQWVGVGVFNGQCRSQAPLWRASGHPHGSGKDTTLSHVFVSVYVRSQTDTSSYCSIYSS